MTPSSRSNSSRPRSSRIRAQGRAHALDDGAQAGQPGPRLHVGDGRRAEGTQVAAQGGLRVRVGRDRPADPRLDRRQLRLAGAAPQAARRDLERRQQVAHRVGEAARVADRDLAAELRAQLRQRARPLLDERAPEREDGLEVDAVDAPRPRPVREQLAVEDGLDDRAQEERVVGRDEVDRPAHEHDPDRAPVLHRLLTAWPGRTARAGRGGRCTARWGAGPGARRGARRRRAGPWTPARGGAGARAASG